MYLSFNPASTQVRNEEITLHISVLLQGKLVHLVKVIMNFQGQI